MLPKVATHLLHSTSRAAAAVQNQSHTIRSVLHSSSSSSPSSSTLAPWNASTSSSSGGSSNGPGPGGQKYTGSRYYTGYTGAGRAVTQANAITSQDGTVGQTDDQDELPARRVSLHVPRHSRPRSHSLSSPQPPSPESLGVLKTVQLHARSRHAFAADPTPPALVRRNSTSVAPQDAPQDAYTRPLTPPPPSPTSSRRAPAATDPAAPQTVAPPLPPSESPAFIDIIRAQRDADPGRVVLAVRNLIDNVQKPSVREFNAALNALRLTRRPGEPLIMLMETYNAMLNKSLLPTLRTYFELITAITDRDHEIFTTISVLEARANRNTARHTDLQRIANLRAENTFDAAMKLFDSVKLSDSAQKIPMYIYEALLRSCANHENQASALILLGDIEARTDLKPTAAVYKHMLRAYASPSGINSAEMVFEEFLRRSTHDGIDWSPTVHDPDGPRRQHLQVWNQMIVCYFRAGLPDKAVETLERMINSPAPAAFGPADVPHPASSTYTVTISGFIQSGDLDTALAWFHRLLAQTERPRQPFESALQILRPDSVAWQHILDGLAFAGRVDDLNELFLKLLECAPTDGVRVRDADRELLYVANVERLPDLSNEQAAAMGRFLVQHVLSDKMDIPRLVRPLWEAFVARGMYAEAIGTVRTISGHAYAAEHPAAALVRLVLARPNVPLGVMLELVGLAQANGVPVAPEQGVLVLHAYADDAAPKPALDQAAWAFLIGAAIDQEFVASRPKGYKFRGLIALLEDMAAAGDLALADMPPWLVRRVVKAIFVKYGVEELRALFTRLGPRFASVLDDPAQAAEALASAIATAEAEPDTMSDIELEQPSVGLAISKQATDALDQILSRPPAAQTSTAALAYNMFVQGLANQHAPAPAVLGKLIQVLGRAFELERVREAYTVAQTVLQGLEAHKAQQSEGWFAIENSMIIALAHAGDLEAAHVHRMRILELGGAPSADAYGALILYVKDTTDDTSNAMALFQESQVHRVHPNLYLYNNIISKLAKARKADYALELFEQMKAGGFCRPSSITYGAVIGACARVGDVASAENLFAEMMASPGYKPRVPPFNTMMQLYTTTKPNRERALHFYNKLRSAGIQPTAHTYKLLMDAYGKIEPVDIPTMEQIWWALQSDKSVELQGNHFASLIYVYGCVQKDMDKAIAVFNAIPSTPRAPQRDAVVFEALINTLVAHRRPDLMPEYVSMMTSEGVHMTAYIANFLIKGYADVGDMDQARTVFEGLVDPPSGIAAVHNHAPHDPAASPVIDPLEPVYREPSTWEAMVRAELGAGYRQNAEALLGRLQARCYPEAVYNRISGILVDHSQVLS
ncbi:hypothetical protein FB451DRAFT_1084055 [Mycena latifolia]|nr:hypothetical protein FB451DRAFT_1084055 [Mycena latifolia]